MSFEYVVVQAGGRGSRMGTLTANKPKALVTVDNLPIIFHLFKKYPDKKFIIIGDYKSDVLEKYLSAFAVGCLVKPYHLRVERLRCCLCCILFRYLLSGGGIKKKSLREQHIQRLIDAFIYPLIISLIAIFFTDAAGFCAINLFLPAIILMLICVEDEVCKKTVDDILCFIKEHKIISASVFVAVFAFAFKGMINYHSLKQLVFYLRY